MNAVRRNRVATSIAELATDEDSRSSESALQPDHLKLAVAPRIALDGGAEMQTYYPVSSIRDGQGLNVTVVSDRDHLEFGLIACLELVPDIEELRTAGTPRPFGCAVLGRA